jgi:MATE family multidrug resistance protein
MGFIGAPVALTITDNLLPWCLLLYAYWGKRDKCWHGFTRQALHGWGPMIRLAIPGFLTAEAESLTWAINTAVASYLGPNALAAQTILSTVVHIAWQISYALSNSTRVRMGNWIGAASEYAARTANKAALYVALTSGVAIMAFLLACRDYIARTFTTDARVIDLVLGVIPLCGVAQLCEASSMVAGAVLCGVGQPHVTSCVQGLAFLVTLPTILGTVFWLGWHIYGLWVAAILSPLCAACVEWVFLRGVSWKACIDDGMKNLGV